MKMRKMIMKMVSQNVFTVTCISFRAWSLLNSLLRCSLLIKTHKVFESLSAF